MALGKASKDLIQLTTQRYTKVNGNAYDWNSLYVSIQGVLLMGISEINYEDSQDMEFVYGTGVYPVDRAYGKYSATADITLSVGEMTLLERSSISELVQNLPPFTIVIVHMPSNQLPATTLLRNCKIMSNSRNLNQNDMNPQVKLELSVSHIQRY